jgi:hypothetical protein
MELMTTYLWARVFSYLHGSGIVAAAGVCGRWREATESDEWLSPHAELMTERRERAIRVSVEERGTRYEEPSFSFTDYHQIRITFPLTVSLCRSISSLVLNHCLFLESMRDTDEVTLASDADEWVRTRLIETPMTSERVKGFVFANEMMHPHDLLMSGYLHGSRQWFSSAFKYLSDGDGEGLSEWMRGDADTDKNGLARSIGPHMAEAVYTLDIPFVSSYIEAGLSPRLFSPLHTYHWVSDDGMVDLSCGRGLEKGMERMLTLIVDAVRHSYPELGEHGRCWSRVDESNGAMLINALLLLGMVDEAAAMDQAFRDEALMEATEEDVSCDGMLILLLRSFSSPCPYPKEMLNRALRRVSSYPYEFPVIGRDDAVAEQSS